jgi:hypothetical protein
MLRTTSKTSLRKGAGLGPRHSLPPPISLDSFSAARTGLLPLPKHSNEACSEAAGDQQKEEVSGRVAHGIYDATDMPLPFWRRLLRWLQPGQGNPLAKVSCGFALPRLPHQCIALRSGRHHLRTLSIRLRLFREPVFKGFGMFCSSRHVLTPFHRAADIHAGLRTSR